MDQNFVTTRRKERFFAHIDKSGECWNWTAHIDRYGYGRFCSKAAHRFAVLLNGEKLIKGMDIDHLCRNRKCVNPNHLEQVTRKENIRRGDTGKYKSNRITIKTMCINGHSFSQENTYLYTTKAGKIQKMCRTCNRESHRRRKLAKKILIKERKWNG